MKKKLFIAATLAAVLAAPLSAMAKTAPTKENAKKALKPLTMQFATGKITESDGSDLYFTTLRPGFKIRNFGISLDLNLYFDNEARIRDKGNDTVVLGSVDYENKGRFKLHYGDIENLTFGSGFIVSNYRLNIKNDVPVNRQKGAQMELTSSVSTIKLFATRTDLAGIRAVRKMKNVTLGATMVTDSTPTFDEVAVDAQVPIISDKTALYGEVARITNHGDGFALGVLSSLTTYADAKFELRDYDSDFIPGIVDEHYEVSDPAARIAASPAGRMLGYFSSLTLLPGNEIWATVTYEDYENYKPRTTLVGEAKFSEKLKADLFYATQNGILQKASPVREDSIARARLHYQIRKQLEIVLDYYNAFRDNRTSQESFTVKANFDLW